MKKLLLIILILITKISISQEFKSKDDFIDSIPVKQRKEISSKIETKWLSQMTDDDVFSMKYSQMKSSKKVNITWDLSYTDYSYLSNYINGFYVSIVNQSNKTIKYVNFNVKGLNAVGDLVYDGYKSRTGIGPVGPYETGSWSFDNCWIYDNTINEVEIISMSIEYTDKSKLIIKNVSDIVINLDIAEKYNELLKKRVDMIDNYYDSLYNSEKEKHYIKLAKIAERNKFITDSINKRIQFVKDSTENSTLKTYYFELKNSLVKNKIELDSVARNLTILDEDKKNFINITFIKNINDDLNEYKDILNKLYNIETKIDTNNNVILTNYISKYKPYLNININKYYKKIDKDFISNKLKKTKLYKEYKELYKKQKKSINDEFLLRENLVEFELMKLKS